jgi:hypothetical protein
MKRPHIISLMVQMPVADALSTLQPEIESIVSSRVADARSREFGRFSALPSGVAQAMANMSTAVTRYENSQHSKAEGAAIGNLIASAKGFNKAYLAFKKER